MTPSIAAAALLILLPLVIAKLRQPAPAPVRARR